MNARSNLSCGANTLGRWRICWMALALCLLAVIGAPASGPTNSSPATAATNLLSAAPSPSAGNHGPSVANVVPAISNAVPAKPASFNPPSTAHAAPEAQTNDSTVPPEIDRALRDSQQALASTNLLHTNQATAEATSLAALQAKLDLGRQQRRARDFVHAEQTFSEMLDGRSQCPEEFQRSALLELALVAQESKQLARAQQLYSRYCSRYRDDPSVPEVLLRQGLMYREMGAPVLALSKFYAVMSSALSLKLDRLAYYQRLVLQAQTEIADTYYLEGKYGEAAEFFNRLLRLDSPELNREQVLYKLVRAYSAGEQYTQALAQAQLFVARHPGSDQLPEVRFILADALRHLGRKQEAMQEVLALLRTQRAVADQNQEVWLYWQQRMGNAIANQLYLEGDLANALEIYLRLAGLNSAPAWRLPALYQAGLIYERLKQPEKAGEMYGRIAEDGKALEGKPEGTDAGSMGLVLDMARWRKERLGWQAQAELASQQLLNTSPPAGTNAAPPTATP